MVRSQPPQTASVARSSNPACTCRSHQPINYGYVKDRLKNSRRTSDAVVNPRNPSDLALHTSAAFPFSPLRPYEDMQAFAPSRADGSAPRVMEAIACPVDPGERSYRLTCNECGQQQRTAEYPSEDDLCRNHQQLHRARIPGKQAGIYRR